MTPERRRELQKRRMRLAEERENADNRAKHGKAVVSKLKAALQTELSLDQFEANKKLPIELDWCSDFRDFRGLIAVYTSEFRSRDILSCCDGIIGSQDGTISLDDHSYLGAAVVGSIYISRLLEAAKVLEDSILFCPDKYSDSIIMVDRYRTSGMTPDVDFSIVIQGKQLEQKLAPCFANVIKFDP